MVIFGKSWDKMKQYWGDDKSMHQFLFLSGTYPLLFFFFNCWNVEVHVASTNKIQLNPQTRIPLVLLFVHLAWIGLSCFDFMKYCLGLIFFHWPYMEKLVVDNVIALAIQFEWFKVGSWAYYGPRYFPSILLPTQSFSRLQCLITKWHTGSSEFLRLK